MNSPVPSPGKYSSGLTAQCELVKVLSVNFTEDRVLYALKVLIAKVLKKVLNLRSRLCTLIVEVSVDKNKHRTPTWISPSDAPFRLRSFEKSISPFTLQPSALSHLETFRSVHVDPDILCEVPPPYRDHDASCAVHLVSLFSEYGYRALEVLLRTSIPAQCLVTLIVNATVPNKLFQSSRLSHLEALHIVALVQQYKHRNPARVPAARCSLASGLRRSW
ncbi:hypothetical protein EI94DRAFT_1815209 [Lactarius quietus]|nr:hypothetical protein EI94DRAFT_1815209 [Lactarius quietus]